MEDLRLYYEILGIEPDASIEEIKQAHKDLVTVWHPDRFSNSPRLQRKASEKLKEINLAYEKIMVHIAKTQAEISQPKEKESDTDRSKNSKSNQSQSKSTTYSFRQKTSGGNHMKKYLIIAAVIIISFLILLPMVRYETAEIGIVDFRYDRFTSTVYIKHIRASEWQKTRFKNLREAKYWLERKAIRDAIESSR